MVAKQTQRPGMLRRVVDTVGEELLNQAANGLVSFASRMFSRSPTRVVDVAPLANSLRQSSCEPKFTNVDGVVAIEHTEALPIVAGAQVVQFSSTSLKWLNNIASGFEEYRIQLEFGFIPICPATTTGSVKMAWDYDPSDLEAYESYEDYFNTADHCIAAVWSAAYIGPKPGAFLKTGISGDARLFSPGALKYEVSDPSAGYMMVRYKVQLRKPQPSAIATQQYAVYSGSYTTTTAPLADAALIGGSSGLVSLTGDNKFTQLRSGRYLITWSTDGASPTGSTVTSTMLRISNIYSVGSGKATTFYSNAVANETTLTITPAPAGATTWELTIIELPISPYYQI